MNTLLVQFWWIFLVTFLANVGCLSTFDENLLKNFNVTKIGSLTAPWAKEKDNSTGNGQAKTTRIEFALQKEMFQIGMKKPCNTFILCYESALDSENGRTRPQFWLKARNESKLSWACQKLAGKEGEGIWHGIGLRICVNDKKSWTNLRTTFSKRCYGTMVLKNASATNSEWIRLLAIELGIGISKRVSTLPTAKFYYWVDSMGQERYPAYMGAPKEMRLWNGAKMLGKEAAAFWLLPLDIFLQNGTEMNFQLVHHNEFTVNEKKNSEGTQIQLA